MVHSHSNRMRVASYVTGLIVQCSDCDSSYCGSEINSVSLNFIVAN